MGDEERTEQRAARDALGRDLERAMFHLKAAAGASGHRGELRSGLEDARRAVAALAKEAALGRVYASTGAERDAAAPGNLVVGVTAHCMCGRTFTDDVRCGFAEIHPGAATGGESEEGPGPARGCVRDAMDVAQAVHDECERDRNRKAGEDAPPPTGDGSADLHRRYPHLAGNCVCDAPPAPPTGTGAAPPAPDTDDEDRSSMAAWGDPEGFRGSDYD